jgi:hypothetical protein
VPVVFKDAAVVCRAPHDCVWCAERIDAGKPARTQAGIVNGEFFAWHMHPECFAAADSGNDDPDGMFEPGVHARGSAELTYGRRPE